jgi:adenylate kinase
VVNFKVEDEVIIHRLSGRRIHKVSGKIFNVNPDGVPRPPADMHPSELYQRDDDKPEAIRNRLVVYRQQTEPLIRFYRQRQLLRDVIGVGDIDAIISSVRSAVNA